MKLNYWVVALVIGFVVGLSALLNPTPMDIVHLNLESGKLQKASLLLRQVPDTYSPRKIVMTQSKIEAAKGHYESALSELNGVPTHQHNRHYWEWSSDMARVAMNEAKLLTGYEALLKTPSQNESIRNDLIHHYQWQHKYQRAIMHLQIQIKQHPKNSTYRDELAKSYLAMGNLDGAIQTWLQKCRDFPENPADAQVIDLALLTQNPAPLKELIKLRKPRHFNLVFYVAQIYFNAGHYSDAQGKLEALHRQFPHNPQYANLLGLTYDRLGYYVQACEIYAQLLAKNPAQSEYSDQLYWASQNLMPDWKVRYAVQLVRMRPSLQFRLYLAKSLLENGQEQAGIREYETLLTQYPNDAQIRFTLAHYFFDKDPEKAWELVKNLDPKTSLYPNQLEDYQLDAAYQFLEEKDYHRAIQLLESRPGLGNRTDSLRIESYLALLESHAFNRHAEKALHVSTKLTTITQDATLKKHVFSIWKDVMEDNGQKWGLDFHVTNQGDAKSYAQKLEWQSTWKLTLANGTYTQITTHSQQTLQLSQEYRLYPQTWLRLGTGVNLNQSETRLGGQLGLLHKQLSGTEFSLKTQIHEPWTDPISAAQYRGYKNQIEGECHTPIGKGLILQGTAGISDLSLEAIGAKGSGKWASVGLDKHLIDRTITQNNSLRKSIIGLSYNTALFHSDYAMNSAINLVPEMTLVMAQFVNQWVFKHTHAMELGVQAGQNTVLGPSYGFVWSVHGKWMSKIKDKTALKLEGQWESGGTNPAISSSSYQIKVGLGMAM